MRWFIHGFLSWIQFVGIGLIIAGIGETQFSVFICSDVQNLMGSVAFNTFYLTIASFMSWLLIKRFGEGPAIMLCHAFGSGGAGLLIEWFLIGNSPWENPQANQIGMFTFWSAMVLIPFISLRPHPYLAKLKKRIWASVLIYTYGAFLIQLIPNQSLHFIYHIWAVILGYTFLVLLCSIGYLRVFRKGNRRLTFES